MGKRHRRQERAENPGHDAAPPSGRYTPAHAAFRRRPKVHRVLGWLGVAAGVAIAIVNDAMLFTDHRVFLPGGHQELYLLLAIAVAGASTWFLGLFDRGTTVFD